MLNQFNQLLAPRNRYFSPGWTNYIPQFLWIFGFCFRNGIFNVTPQVTMGLRLGDLATPQSLLSGTKMLLAYSCVWGRCLVETPISGAFRQHNLFKYFDVFKLIRDPWYTINRPNNEVWRTSPYHDSCVTMLHRLHSVPWHEFSTRGSSDVLSTATRAKKNNFTHQSRECYAISLWANRCVPWQIWTDSAHAVFSTMVLYGSFLPIA